MSGQGLLGSVHISEQTSFGTINQDSYTAIPVITENLNLEIAQLDETNMYTRFGESPTHEGVHVVNGALQCEPEPLSMGYLLKAVCGDNSVSFVASEAFHNFLPLDSGDFDDKASLPPFTVLTDRDVASGMAYFDCLATGMTLEAANSELLSLGIDWVGGQYQDVANVVPSYSDKAPWAWNTCSVQYNGILTGNLRSLTVELQNNLEPIYTLTTSKSPDKIKRTAAYNITGSLVLDFVSNSLMAEFTAQNERQLLVSFMSDVESPAQFQIDVPKCRFSEYQTGISGTGMLQLTANFRGKYDTTSSYAIEFILTNSKPDPY